MVLVFIFLGLIMFLAILMLVLMVSTLKVKIKDFRIENCKNNKRYKIYIQLYLLNKVKIFSFKIDSKKLNKLSKSNSFKNIDFQRFKENMPSKKVIFNGLKILNFKIDKFKLNLQIGLEEAEVTSYVVATIASLIGIIIPRFVDNKENVKYNIIPIYNQNNLNIFLESIFSIKMVNTFSMLSYIKKKGSGKNGGTSYRKSYGYSHGFN